MIGELYDVFKGQYLQYKIWLLSFCFGLLKRRGRIWVQVLIAILLLEIEKADSDVILVSVSIIALISLYEWFWYS